MSGLVASYYLGFPIVTKKTESPPIPRYLREGPNTAALLRDLGLSTRTRKVRAGIYDGGKFLDPTPSVREEYSVKTYGKWVPWAMGGGLEFEAYYISWFQLENILKWILKDNIFYDEVIGIKGKKLIGRKGTWEFDCLISTIPLPELCQMLGIKHNLEYRTVLVATYKGGPEWLMNSQYDYVYLLGNFASYRITKGIGMCYAESCGTVVLDSFGTLMGIQMLKYGKIVGGEVPQIPPDIKLLGRFSEWRPKEMLEDVIGRVKSWKL